MIKVAQEAVGAFVEALAASQDERVAELAVGLMACIECDDSQCGGFGNCTRVQALQVEMKRNA